jgi:hypothetical protein
MRGPAVSDAIEKESTAAQELGQRPGSAQGEGTARALRRPTQKRETSGPREKNWASGPKARRKEIFFFFFLFKYYKAFPNNFESKFEFESNHSLQKFKCNSMSAQTCFYSYI